MVAVISNDNSTEMWANQPIVRLRWTEPKIATKPESPEVKEEIITRLLRLLHIGQNVDMVV